MGLLAFDLGGTRLKAGVVGRGGEVVDFTTAPTAGDADDALRTLRTVGEELAGRHGCDGVGLCVPGLVDDDGRVVTLPGKLDGIVGRNLRGELASWFAAPAIVVNDAVAYGAGEAWFGAGRGHTRVVVVTIGTGVGVAVLEDGAPVSGGPLGGGILGGQVPISDPVGPTDTSGRRGTIEARCAAQRIVTSCDEAGGAYADVAAVYAAAAAGEDVAQQGIAAYRAWLARALVALVHAHAPSMVVLGGGPMTPGNPVVTGLHELVADQLWSGVRVELRVAELGDHAALAGLARLHRGGT